MVTPAPVPGVLRSSAEVAHSPYDNRHTQPQGGTTVQINVAVPPGRAELA